MFHDKAEDELDTNFTLEMPCIMRGENDVWFWLISHSGGWGTKLPAMVTFLMLSPTLLLILETCTTMLHLIIPFQIKFNYAYNVIMYLWKNIMILDAQENFFLGLTPRKFQRMKKKLTGRWGHQLPTLLLWSTRQKRVCSSQIPNIEAFNVTGKTTSFLKPKLQLHNDRDTPVF